MIKNQTYRLIAAFFFAALVFQVFILQGLHHIYGHHHEVETCSIEGAHIHADGHEHFSCDICLFHFAPTDLHPFVLAVAQPSIVSTELPYGYPDCHFAQKYRQSCLRGPPHTTF